jgi:uncharacterized membrane protein YjgN (DUF898 family)
MDLATSTVTPTTSFPTKERSYFDGGLLELIGVTILTALISSVTLGIATPWGLCMIYSWQINHTVVEGKRLHFNGKGGSLFGSWIKWAFFCIITVGIYGFWMGIALEKWKAENTSFE